MSDYALIRGGAVQNVIVAGPEFIASIAHDWEAAVDIDGLDPRPGIGWSWDGSALIAPPVPEPLPEPDPVPTVQSELVQALDAVYPGPVTPEVIAAHLAAAQAALASPVSAPTLTGDASQADIVTVVNALAAAVNRLGVLQGGTITTVAGLVKATLPQ